MPVRWLTEDVGIIELRTNVGVIRRGGECTLIDSGLDEDAGRRVLKALSEEGLRVVAIFNTHSHADHYGADAFIKARTGAKVIAPFREAPIIEDPWLEPFYFSGGASPLGPLLNKFLMGRPCKVDIKVEGGPFEVGGMTMEAIPLPGHSPGLMGIAVKCVLFCGDALFGQEVIEKHKVLYLHDPDLTRDSLAKIKSFAADFVVPSHGRALTRDQVAELVEANLKAIDALDRAMLDTITSPMSVSVALSKSLKVVGLTLNDLPEAMLMRATALAHLTGLSRRGKIKVAVGEPASALENDVVCAPAQTTVS
jgi:glyoxylase-like metal-dependent hydrolase (beta-lactamase superfamily II)